MRYTDEFENAMNEGRIERKHCKWMLAEVKRLRKELMRAVDWHLDYIEGTSGSAVDFLDHVEEE